MNTRWQNFAVWIPGHFLTVLAGWLVLVMLTALVCGLGAALVVGLAAALIGEAGLRWVFRTVYGPHYLKSLFLYLLEDHSVYGYGLRPGLKLRQLDFPVFDKFAFPWGAEKHMDLAANQAARVDFNVDSLGFRGPGFDPARKTARLRIFCSGGSTTACDSVDDTQTWPAVLERELRAKGFDVEVINAGVEGWFSYQEYLRYDREIRHYQPDIVLMHQGWNEEFQYSSLGLGRFWKPKLVRNVLETNFLYSPPSALLSSRRSLVWLFAVQSLLRKFLFLRTMRFSNPGRWRCLFARDYMLEWFDSMVGILRLAAADNVLAYSVDYPSLVDITDKPSVRQHIIANTIVPGRLNVHFADFQAITKKGTSHFLKDMGALVPCLDTNTAFAGLSADERLALFGDELHYTAAGCEMVGRALAERLAADPAFLARYQQGKDSAGNISLDEERIARLRDTATAGRPYLRRMIEAKICKVMDENDASRLRDIPVDRYTTL